MTDKPELSPAGINDLAGEYGSCFATEMLVAQGEKVACMYRDDPRSETDSGWLFMSGHESQEYLENPANLRAYEVSTIVDCDPDIVAYLDAPYGSGFERNDEGQFVEILDIV